MAWIRAFLLLYVALSVQRALEEEHGSRTARTLAESCADSVLTASSNGSHQALVRPATPDVFHGKDTCQSLQISSFVPTMRAPGPTDDRVRAFLFFKPGKKTYITQLGSGRGPPRLLV